MRCPIVVGRSIVVHVRNKSNLAALNTWETYTSTIFPSSWSCLVWINGFSMWLELIWWICNVLIFHQHILLIACEPLLNLMTNYLICVAGKQWEALRFTIEVSTCMVRCLIAHYCAITGTILIFRFLTIWSCTCRSCCQRFWPTVQLFLHMGKWVVHEYQSNQKTQKDC